MSASLTTVLDRGLEALQLVEHELLLFAAFWFIVGAFDELAVDIAWLWLKLSGQAEVGRTPDGLSDRPLAGRLAVFVPAWHEAEVIGAMIAHTLRSWPQADLRLFVGCYCNDAATLAAAIAAANNDPRLRLVITENPGPTTKADCLNRLYAAMSTDEARSGLPFEGIVLHDAEDMVHADALAAIDRALQAVDFVQLPVRPEPMARSRWISGHYADEFAEAHGKTMVVRDALGAAIPAAGVGCGFRRTVLASFAAIRAREGEAGPFASECLTEDYELGLLVARYRAKSCFLRLRDRQGALVATRAYFPARIDEAVRQKARWLHGIAFQGWERLGWSGGPVDWWMILRDRKGPLTALVLAIAYILVMIEAALGFARLLGWQGAMPPSQALSDMLVLSFASFIWRALWRCAFTALEYGMVEGLRALPRILVGNVIAIMSGRHAMLAYLQSLRGDIVHWDKTTHRDHPAMVQAMRHKA